MPEAVGTQTHLEDYTELAWAAGFFDGEGTFCLRTHRYKDSTYKYPFASLAQNEAALVDRFHDAVGVGRCHFENSRQVVVWHATNLEQVQVVVCRLWRWLGPFKRDQARRTLQGVQYGSRGRYYGHASH